MRHYVGKMRIYFMELGANCLNKQDDTINLAFHAGSYDSSHQN